MEIQRKNVVNLNAPAQRTDNFWTTLDPNLSMMEMHQNFLVPPLNPYEQHAAHQTGREELAWRGWDEAITSANLDDPDPPGTYEMILFRNREWKVQDVGEISHRDLWGILNRVFRATVPGMD